jgi:YYY domain-containing protein
MTAFLSWYLILTLLGWLTFPLAHRLFPALGDRGYSLSRAAGLLIWGYIFWLLTSLGLTQNTIGGILFALLVLVGLSFSSFFFRDSGIENHKLEIVNWLKSNLRLILTVEVLFLVAFALLAFLRAGNPELDGTERPMELMFINAILRSPAFPPHDSWLSGYAISYYYFGYVLTAMLAKLAGLPGSLAHNLMTALIFALASVGAYGILYNLLALFADHRPQTTDNSSSIVSPLLAPLFLLLVSNLGGFLEVLHTRGIFWNSNPSNFWTWLDIRELSAAPVQPNQWIPNRYLWWWRASRVISDFDLHRNFLEIIDEFPFFSFLLGDLHPHVLAIPFNLLTVALALNTFLGGFRGETDLFGLRLKISKMGFLASAVTLGGLAFLNTWDILVAAALMVGAYILFRVREEGWSWTRLEDVFALGLPLGFCAILLYLPFYFGFTSQAGGILPNLINPTRGAQLWVMFAPLFVPILVYLLYLWRGEKRRGNWPLSLLLVAGTVLLLWGFSWLIGWLAFLKDPGFAQSYLASQGLADVAGLFRAAISRRFSSIGGLLTLLALLVPALAFLTAERGSRTEDDRRLPTANHLPSSFILLLILLASLLVLAPEFVYLRDQFSTRMNTIFKFYYQAWLLFSIAAAFGTAVLLQKLRGAWEWVFGIGIVLLLFMSLTYPALAIPNKTNNFQPVLGWTLDDFARIQRNDPDEAAAIIWLKSAPDGVIAEAAGGGYTSYGRISAYTGLPAVLNWGDHESQWGRGGAELGTREDDIALLYSTPDRQIAFDILRKYDIRYVYIGGLERSKYLVQEDKFHQNLIQVFQQGSVTIYQVP